MVLTEDALKNTETYIEPIVKILDGSACTGAGRIVHVQVKSIRKKRKKCQFTNERRRRKYQKVRETLQRRNGRKMNC